MQLSPRTRFLIMADLTPIADREFSGASQYPATPTSPIYQRESDGSEDSESSEQEDLTTGSSSVHSSPSSHSEEYGSTSAPTMPNSPVPNQPTITFGRKTPVSKERNLSSEQNQWPSIRKSIGTMSGKRLLEGTCPPFQQVSEYVVTLPFEQSPLFMFNVKTWLAAQSCTGEVRGLGNPVKLGNMRAKTIILRILEQSSGMATKVKRMLLSMNIEETSPSATCFAGSTTLQSEWRSKDLPSLSKPNVSGLRVTFRQDNGTPI